MITLYSFCKTHDLPYTSVRRYLQSFEFDTSEGLTDEAQTAVLKEFKPAVLAQQTQQDETPITPTTVVDAGNHKIVLSAPQLPQRYSLEGLRTGEAVQFDDPLAVAASFLQDAEMLEVAMQQDIAARQQRLEATKKAQQAIAEKKQKLELEARLYQLQTQTLDAALSNETIQLQDALGKLQQFTQPAPTPTPQEQSSQQS